jgi:hypothetical protein
LVFEKYFQPGKLAGIGDSPKGPFASLTNIKLGFKYLGGTNALAYFSDDKEKF